MKELSKRPLLEILKEKIDLTIGKGELYIEAILAEPEVADILKIKIFDPLVLLKLNYWFPSGDPIETVNFFIRADYFKYKVLKSQNFFHFLCLCYLRNRVLVKIPKIAII